MAPAPEGMPVPAGDVELEPGTAPGAPGAGTPASEELAAAIRRLIAAAVTSTAPAEVLADAAAGLHRAADELERTVPGPGAGRHRVLGDRPAQPDQAAALALAMPYDIVIGPSNPLAPPVVVEADPPRAIGHVTFTAPYEGAPGYVHGGALASAFDIVLSAANVLADAAGPTVSLTLRYLRPTTVGQPCRFEAWVTDADRRRTHTWGTLTQGGVVTVEAEGVFAQVKGFGRPTA